VLPHPCPSRLLPLTRCPVAWPARPCRLTAASPWAVLLRDHLDVFLFPHCYLAGGGPAGPNATCGHDRRCRTAGRGPFGCCHHRWRPGRHRPITAGV